MPAPRPRHARSDFVSELQFVATVRIAAADAAIAALNHPAAAAVNASAAAAALSRAGPPPLPLSPPQLCGTYCAEGLPNELYHHGFAPTITVVWCAVAPLPPSPPPGASTTPQVPFNFAAVLILP